MAALVVLRAAAGAAFAAQQPVFPARYDGREYRELAASVSEGRGLTIRSRRWFEAPRPDRPISEPYRPPLLPWLAGTLLPVWAGSHGLLLAFQGALGALVAGAVAFLALEVAGPRAAWAGLALATAHPLLLHYSTYFCTELLFTLCLAGFVWAWIGRTGRWRWPAVGAAIGLATLARPTALPLLPLALGFCLAGGRGARFQRAAAVAAAFLVVTSPWMLRNYLSYGEPRPTSWYGGYMVWQGNNRLNLLAYQSAASGQMLRYQGEIMDRTRALADAMGEHGLRHPGEQERYWLEATWRDVREYRAGEWLVLLGGKAWHFWRPWPQRDAHAPRRFWLAAISETVLFACGLAGLGTILVRGPRRALVPLVMLLVAGTAAHTLTFSHMRYRVPFADLVMLVGAAALAGGRRAAPGALNPPRASAAPAPARG